MTWWESLWGEVFSATWVAGLLQATLGTVVAFAGALVIFRQQLKHDRRLAAQQVAADREARVAERRAAAAAALGRSILDATRLAENPSLDAKGAELERATTMSPAKARAPGAREFSDAIQSATLILTDLEPTIWDLWRPFTWSWSAAVGAGPPLVAADDTANTRTKWKRAGAAYEATAFSIWNELHDIGRSLIRWDGEGPVPLMDALPADHPLRSSAGLTPRPAWIATFQEEMATEYARQVHFAEERR